MNQLQRLSRQIARLQVEFMHAKRAAIGTGHVKAVDVKLQSSNGTQGLSTPVTSSPNENDQRVHGLV